MFKTVLGKYNKNTLVCKDYTLKVYPYERDIDKVQNQYGFFQLKTFNGEDLETAEKFIINNYTLLTEQEYNQFILN